MSNAISSTPRPVRRFPSLAALRSAHAHLLKRHREQGMTPEMLAMVQVFLQQGRATGALLDVEEERWTAQSLLDYWSTTLYRVHQEPPDATLNEFDPLLAPALPDALCPYVGLDAFREEHAQRFFGRQRLVTHLITQLHDHPLVAVVGPSGSGKSSLVRAGLIPALKAGALSGSAHWRYYPPLLPGSTPLIHLAQLVQPSRVNPEAWKRIQVQRFREDSLNLLRLINTLVGVPTVITIDQFEELFTLCADDQERQAFVANLVGLIQAPGTAHRVILTLRSDFEAFVTRLPELQPYFEQSRFQVTPLSAGDLREAIEKPAAQVGLKFASGLVDTLLQDILGEPAALPLLQFTLLKLWERRERNRVTWEAYHTIGGGRLALARSADELYNNLIPEEQMTARRILLRMVRPGTGLEVTSNRIRRADLYHSGEDPGRVDRVLNKLIAACLVRLTEGKTAEDAQVEVAHEALVRNWPTLVDWLEDERETLRRRQRLTTAAEQWQRLNKDPGLLWRGLLLNEALSYKDLNKLEREFVRASLAAVEQAEREKEAIYRRQLAQAQALAAEQQRRAEAERQRAEEERLRAEAERQRAEERTRAEVQSQANKRLRLFTIALVIVSILAVTAAVFAGLKQQEVQRTASMLETEVVVRSTAEADAVAARQTSETAAAQQITAQAQAFAEREARLATQNIVDFQATEMALQSTAQAQTEAERQTAVAAQAAEVEARQIAEEERNRATAGSIAFQALSHLEYQLDLSLLLSVEAYQSGANPPTRGTLLISLEHNPILQRFLRGQTGEVNSVAFSPNGQILAVGSSDHTIRLYDPATGQPVGEPLEHTGAVLHVAFNPQDSTMLASAGSDNTVRVWDIQTGQLIGHPLTGHTKQVWSVAFSPDGRILASGSADSTIMLWNIATQRPVGTLTGHARDVSSVAFSRDARLLASGSADGKVILWSVTDPAKPKLIKAFDHGSWVRSVAFSPTDTLLASSGGNEIKFWNTSQLTQSGAALTSHTNSVVSVAFSPDGKTLVSGSLDRTLRRWDVATRQPRGTPLTSHTGWVWSVAFHPNGHTLASGSWDTTVILWDIDAHQRLGTPRTAQFVVTDLAFSSDGQFLASGGDNGVVVWNRETNGPAMPAFRGQAVTALDYRPQSTMLAIGNRDGTITLWDNVAYQGTKQVSAHRGEVTDLAFSQDGTLLVSSSQDGTIMLWNVDNSFDISPRFRLVLENGPIWSVALTPDATTLAAGVGEETVFIWSMNNLQQESDLPSHMLEGHTGYILALAFNSEGTLLASGSADNTIRLWDIATWEQHGQPLIGHSSSVASIAFSPNGQTLASASIDTTIALWDVITGQRIGQPLNGHTGKVTSVAFSPDGQTLVSGSKDMQVILWDMNVESWQNRACQVANRNLTEAEWGQFIGSDIPYDRTCPELP